MYIYDLIYKRVVKNVNQFIFFLLYKNKKLVNLKLGEHKDQWPSTYLSFIFPEAKLCFRDIFVYFCGQSNLNKRGIDFVACV